MYKYISEAISLGGYNLNVVLDKIAVSWALGHLTDEEKTELEEMAKDRANPADSLPGIDERVASLEKAVREINAKLESKVDKDIPTVDETDEEPKEFSKPVDLITDAYFKGDKIKFGDKMFVCEEDSIVLDPDTYPTAWKEIVDSAVDLVEEVAENA